MDAPDRDGALRARKYIVGRWAVKLKKGQVVEVAHTRKGVFIAVVLRDFDTEDEIFWPLGARTEPVWGINESWGVGEQIPCRGSMVKSVDVLAVGGAGR